MQTPTATPASSHREAMPYPDAHAPLAGAGDLSELGWSVDPLEPSALVSSGMLPEKACDHSRARARESVAMAVRIPVQV